MSAEQLLKPYPLALKAFHDIVGRYVATNGEDAEFCDFKNTLARMAIILHDHSDLPRKEEVMAYAILCTHGWTMQERGPAGYIEREYSKTVAGLLSHYEPGGYTAKHQADRTAAFLTAKFERAVRGCTSDESDILLAAFGDEKNFLPAVGRELKSLYVRARESFMSAQLNDQASFRKKPGVPKKPAF